MSRKKKHDDEQDELRSGSEVQPKATATREVESGLFERTTGTLVDVRGGLGGEAELIKDINATLRIIEELRASAHEDDEEMARLGEETRGLIADMQKELRVA